MYYIVIPKLKTLPLDQLIPEGALMPALPFSFLPPIGLFIFAWTSRADIHWIVSLIGAGIYTSGIFIVFQCLFAYIGASVSNHFY